MRLRHLLLFVSILTLAAPQLLAQTSNEDIIQSVETLHAAGKFDGVLMLADDKEILHQSVFGLAHRGHGVKNKIDTKFNTASMYKMFTAVAVMQLVEKGKLSL